MQIELLGRIVRLLNEAEIPYMVVGSFASTFHGEPRMTRDIDLVIDPSPESIVAFVDRLDRNRFYVSDAKMALRDRDMFNVIDTETGWKADFIIRKRRAFSVEEMGRRVLAKIGGVELFVASAEDTVLAKLEWGKRSGSERQFSDVVAIVASQDLDREYLVRWAQELGVSDGLRNSFEAATQDQPQGPDGSC